MRYLPGIIALSLAGLSTPGHSQSFESDGPPTPPMGASPNLTVPPVGADGQYETPNRRLTPPETVWHLRAALNVAALGCRDNHLVADYNAMLSRHAGALARANSGTETAYRVRYGARWESARDGDMTRTYNFFAQPPVQADFCPIAAAILSEIADMPADALPVYAQARLAQIEAPFLNFYARYAAYRVALNDWRDQGRPGIALATVAPVAMRPVVRAGRR